MSYEKYGDLDDVLAVRDLPDPRVGPGEALVEVRSVGINPVDWKLVGGGLDPLMEVRFPAIPGWDVSGVVRAVGPDTPEVSVGDAVLAYARKDWVQAGTLAELVAVPARALAIKPEGLDWDRAAALPLVGLTAARTLIEHLRVGEGDVVLVHNAAGGVGRLAVQLARELGAARVIGTASEANHARLRDLGAEPVAYGEGLTERVRELAPEGVTAVADLVGGVWEVTRAVLREGGRHASIADHGEPAVADHIVWVRPDAARLQWLADLAGDGRLQVDVAGVHEGLDAAPAAFAENARGHGGGKLVVRVSND